MISQFDYQRLIKPHVRAQKQLEVELDFFLQDMGSIDVYHVCGRIKTYESALRKSTDLGIPIESLDDLVGIRLVVGTTNDMPIVERFFTRQTFGKDLAVLKRRDLSRQDGYKALHLVVELNSHYQRSVFPGRVEVQVHTIFAHAFNTLSRAWRYKQPTQVTSEWNELFVSVSNQLAHLESSVAKLHQSIVEESSNRYDGPLTPHTLSKLIQQEFGESPTMDDLVDQCRMYTDIGFNSVGSVKDFFRNQEVSKLYDAVQSQKNAEPVKYLAAMSKTIFWSMFGLRMGNPGMREFLEALIESGSKQQPPD